MGIFTSVVGFLILIGTCVLNKVYRDTIKNDQRLKQLVILGTFAGLIMGLAGIFLR